MNMKDLNMKEHYRITHDGKNNFQLATESSEATAHCDLTSTTIVPTATGALRRAVTVKHATANPPENSTLLDGEYFSIIVIASTAFNAGVSLCDFVSVASQSNAVKTQLRLKNAEMLQA